MFVFTTNETFFAFLVNWGLQHKVNEWRSQLLVSNVGQVAQAMPIVCGLDDSLFLL